jgi:alpha-1,2-mannosyltransferase
LASESRPQLRRRFPLTPRTVWLLPALSAALLGAMRLFLAEATFSDLKIYQIEGRAILHRWDLYGHLPGVHGYATYPPFAAIVFFFTSGLPVVVLEVLVFVLTIVLLVWSAIATGRLLGVRRDQAITVGCVIAALAVWSEPVFRTLGFGQINVALVALVLWDFTRPETSRLRGVGIGLAAAIKVTPAIFIVYLVLTRRIRFAATALATFVAAFGVSAAVDFSATRDYWTRYLLDPHRVGRLENAVNQTIRGFLVRADHTRDTRPTELIVVLVVLVLGMACAVLAQRFLGDGWGVPACAITGLLVSPISWSHHWVWCVPVVVLIWFEARRWIVPTVAVFWSFAVWAVPHENSAELHFSKIQIALSVWYILYGLAFLALTGTRAFGAYRRTLVTGQAAANRHPPQAARTQPADNRMTSSRPNRWKTALASTLSRTTRGS